MQQVTLGIDFGTTKTMTAWVNPRTGQHELMRLGEGRNYIPTTVNMESGGEMLFGEDADNEAEMALEQYSRCFKMKMGGSSPALVFIEDGTPRSYSARQLAAAFLWHVKSLCEEKAVYGNADAAVITRPVNFSRTRWRTCAWSRRMPDSRKSPSSRNLRPQGTHSAGPARTRLFQNRALVVDWGGGTLDMAVVERSSEKVSTDRKHTASLNDMGGGRFDADFWNYVTRLLKEQHVEIEGEKAPVRHAAQVQARKFKETLSKREGKELRLSTSMGSAAPVAVSRMDFEALIRGSV